jgi:hypothetical protein
VRDDERSRRPRDDRLDLADLEPGHHAVEDLLLAPVTRRSGRLTPRRLAGDPFAMAALCQAMVIAVFQAR